MERTNLTRRDFLRASAGLVVADVVSNILAPVGIKANELGENIVYEGKFEANSDMIDIPYFPPLTLDGGNDWEEVVVAPIVEETIFRTIPSVLVGDRNGEDEIKTSLIGTGDSLKKMTRRELVVGVASSLVFGLIHLSNPGVKVPASPTIDGFSYWYLQRKFGIFSNILAHGSHNLIAITSRRRYRISRGAGN